MGVRARKTYLQPDSDVLLHQRQPALHIERDVVEAAVQLCCGGVAAVVAAARLGRRRPGATHPSSAQRSVLDESPLYVLSGVCRASEGRLESGIDKIKDRIIRSSIRSQWSIEKTPGSGRKVTSDEKGILRRLRGLRRRVTETAPMAPRACALLVLSLACIISVSEISAFLVETRLPSLSYRPRVLHRQRRLAQVVEPVRPGFYRLCFAWRRDIIYLFEL